MCSPTVAKFLRQATIRYSLQSTLVSQHIRSTLLPSAHVFQSTRDSRITTVESYFHPLYPVVGGSVFPLVGQGQGLHYLASLTKSFESKNGSLSPYVVAVQKRSFEARAHSLNGRWCTHHLPWNCPRIALEVERNADSQNMILAGFEVWMAQPIM